MKLNEVISELKELKGIKNKELASQIGCSESQLSMFLSQVPPKKKGKIGDTTQEVSLKTSQIDKCFSRLGIDLDAYINRLNTIQYIARELIKSRFSVEDILNMSQNEMAKNVLLKNDKKNVPYSQLIKQLIPVENVTEFDTIIDNNFFDIECTYPYFRTMVAQCVSAYGKQIDDIKDIGTSLSKTLSLVSAAGIIGGPIAMALVGITSKLLINKATNLMKDKKNHQQATNIMEMLSSEYTAKQSNLDKIKKSTKMVTESERDILIHITRNLLSA